MKLAARIAKNTSALVVSQLVSQAILGFLFIIIARYLGEHSYGSYSFVFSYAVIFEILLDLGLHSIFTRDVARNKKLYNLYFWNILLIKLALTAISYPLLILLTSLLGYALNTSAAIAIIGIYTIFTSFSNYLMAVFRAFENMEYEAITSIIRSACLLILVALSIYLNLGFLSLFFSYLLTGILIMVVSMRFLRKKYPLGKLTIDKKLCYKILKTGLPFVITAIFLTLYLKLDIILLSHMQGDYYVGIYSAAVNFLTLLGMLGQYLIIALFPVFSQYYLQDRQVLRKLYGSVLTLFIAFALPVCMIIFFLSEHIIRLALGNAFSESSIALKLIIWSFALAFVYNCNITLLASANRQKLGAKLTLCMFIMNLILNILLIPQFNYIGVAISKLLSETAAVMLSFIYIRRIIPHHTIKAALIKPLLPCTVMCLLLLAMNHLGYISAGIIISSIAYIILILASGIVKKEHLQQLVNRE
jgi:O-antigen/teichoic acid export membrane protein